MIVLLDESVKFYSERFFAFFQKIHEATTRNFPPAKATRICIMSWKKFDVSSELTTLYL
jgi:hypothetical protein